MIAADVNESCDQGEELCFASDAALREAVVRLAQRVGVSFATVLRAAWALVLARYSAENDIVFACSHAGGVDPNGQGGAEVIALPRTIVLRLELDEGLRGSEWLLRVRRAEREALPRGREPEASSADTLLTILPAGVTLCSVMGAGSEPVANAAEPLQVILVDAENLELRLRFAGRRWSRTNAADMARSFLVVLSALASDEARKLADIPLLSAERRNEILFAWNQTVTPFSEQLLIHELFEARVDANPDATAAECAGVRLSYRELDQRANRVAHALRALGAGPGVRVGVCLPRSLELLVALLGVVKAGAAYVPLDRRHPSARLSFMLDDAEARWVLGDESTSTAFAGRAALAVEDLQTAPQWPSSRPPAVARPSDACYCIYTSGTTGEPNGVLLTHRAVVNTLEWVNRAFEVGPGDRLLFVTSPCFDLSVYDVFGALGAGATVVVTTDAELADPAALARKLVADGITLWNSAPPTLAATLAHCAAAASASLRLVMLSGDWIPVAMPDRIRSAFCNARVVSLGGATEAAIWSNWYSIGEVDAAWTSIPYGVPIQNCRYHVLDAAQRPVPVGVPGELYIGGVCLAQGYLNRPELTRERFIPDPFAREPGERLYKTGDRALYFEDGNLKLLGRADSQVKIRGFRVELGEVEVAVSRLPGVKEAVANTYVDSSGERALAAYVVPKNGTELDTLALREALRQKLPAFAVPSQIVVLDALPVSVNGKIDRKRLPRPDERLRVAASSVPQTDIERSMVELWEEVLQKKPIGVTDDFFALGGHSMLAITLATRIKSKLGLEFPLDRWIERPTIRGLLDSLQRRKTDLAAEHFVSFNASGARAPIVLFPGVHGTLFPFRDLPKLFGPEQPLHLGRPLSDIAEQRATTATIERMVDRYQPVLERLCVQKRVILGGFSFGMLLAFELAKRLRAAGYEVPLLVSIDGMAPGYPEFLSKPERILAHVREMVRGDRRLYVSDRLRNTRRRLLRALGREHELFPGIETATLETRRHLQKVWEVNTHALERYRPDFSDPGHLLLIRAERPERWIGIRELDALHGWGRYVCGKISLVVVPGDHDTVLRESNQSLIVKAIEKHLPAVTSLPAAETASERRQDAEETSREQSVLRRQAEAPQAVVLG